MERLYKLVQKIHILVVILFLQSCPGSGDQELFREVENKKFLIQGGQQVRFIPQGSKWIANVKEKFPTGSRRLDLPVREVDFKVKDVVEHHATLSNHIHIVFPEQDIEGKGCVYIRREVVLGGSKNKKRKEKRKEKEQGEKEQGEKEQSVVAKIEEYKNLLKRAEQGDAEAEFLITKRACDNLKKQKTNDVNSLIKILIRLYKSAFKGYKPAADLLLEEFRIRTNVGQLPDMNLSCISALHKHKDSGYINEMINSLVPIPFSVLYRLELDNAKFRVSRDEFKNYCADLFSYINSYETYQVQSGFIADLINYIRELIKIIEYDNEATKGNLISSNKYIQDNKYLIDIFTILCEHIENILKANYFKDFSQTYKLELVGRFHELLGHIGMSQLNIVSDATDKNLIQKYVKGYWETKGKLRNNFGVPKALLEIDYLEELNKSCEMRLKLLPHLVNYFNPQLQGQVPLKRGKPSKQHYKYTDKRVNDYRRELMEGVENDWGSLQLKMDELNTQFVEACSKRLLSEKDLGAAIKKANEKFFEIERLFFSINRSRNSFGDYFVTHLIDPTYNMDEPTVNNLVELHEFISNLSTKLNIDIHTPLYSLMTKGIVLLSLANNFEQALIRLKAMEVFYSTRSHPENFYYFLAIAYAQCGQYERLSEFYKTVIQKELQQQKEIREKHEKKRKKRIELIKAAQQLAQSTSEPSNLVSVNEKAGKRDPGLNTVNPSIENISELAYQEEVLRQKEATEGRIRRHQQAENERQKKQLFEAATIEEEAQSDIPKEQEIATQLEDLSVSENVVPVQFCFTKRAFNTVSQIFNNDWKISRVDIENLFNELGHTINTATKSSHHIIHIPSGIALVNQDGQIIDMITDLSANLGGHLSLPNWGKVVPEYMQRQICNLLNLIGLNSENCDKGHADERTQVVPIQNNSSVNPEPASQSNSVITNKKKNRKNRKK